MASIATGNGESPRSKRRRLSTPEVAEVDDVRIRKIAPLLPPACLLEDIPLTDGAKDTVVEGRRAVAAIVQGRDDRLLCVVGPCSIHDVKAARQYALKLRKLALEVSSDLLVVMRVYFEKPRTTIGWKGLINDPDLDGSFQINKGLRAARQLLLELNELGVPCGCEFLDTLSPQFTADLVSWGAIGARTTESQCHRELSSGLSMPVGFKNGTSGDVKVAADAVQSATHPHSFLGVSKQGLAAIVHTGGNPHCHVILRGGKAGTNFDAASIAAAAAVAAKGKVNPRFVVDCSHGNSKKVHTNQPIVAASIGEQLGAGSDNIMGVMIESNINAGNQKLSPGVTSLRDLKYGVSVTDACISFDTTVQVLRGLAASVRSRREAKQQQGNGAAASS